jgi:hypothetical protein
VQAFGNSEVYSERKRYKITVAFNSGNALQYLHMKYIKCTDPMSETLCSLMFFIIQDNGQIEKKNNIPDSILCSFRISDCRQSKGKKKGKALPVTGHGGP